MRLELKLNKSVEENAGEYFDVSKKAKKKLDGIRKILEEYQEKLYKSKLEVNKISEKKIQIAKITRKKEWYEKFRWFYTSEGFLVIGGRDATTNEIIVKKHLIDGDLVFHTDIPGSPFVVIKSDSNVDNSVKIGEASINEAGTFTACYSKAWKRGLLSSEVFYVAPSQVSKETNSGEFIGKGSFMIYGKKNYISPDMKIAIGIKEDLIIGGPLSAVSKSTDKFEVIIPGDDKTGDVAKKIYKTLGGGELDDIIRFLPAGGVKIFKSRKLF